MMNRTVQELALRIACCVDALLLSRFLSFFVLLGVLGVLGVLGGLGGLILII